VAAVAVSQFGSLLEEIEHLSALTRINSYACFLASSEAANCGLAAMASPVVFIWLSKARRPFAGRQ